MIIDAQSHGLHRDSVDRLAQAGGEWAQKNLNNLLGAKRDRMLQVHDVALRLAQLDRNGIDMQVVTPIPRLDSNLLPGDPTARLAYARIINDGMARLMEDSKGRLLTCGNVPLEGFEQGGRQEMERAMKTLGLKAMCIPTNLRGRPIDIPEADPFWALAAELDTAVYVHPTNPVDHGGRSYEGEYGLTHNLGWPFETELALSRLVFSGILERYPTLKVVSHHLGGGIPFFMGRTVEVYHTAHQQEFVGRVLPKPLFDYFSLFYHDTAVGESAPAVRCAYEVFGADRLLFATDVPFGAEAGEVRLANYPKVIRSVGLSEEENEKIFSGNVRKILNLES
jgi:aminocarboxymuconate-semialdehyde decarboxylase